MHFLKRINTPKKHNDPSRHVPENGCILRAWRRRDSGLGKAPEADTHFITQRNCGIVIIFIFYSFLMTSLSSFVLSTKKMMTGLVMTGLASFFFF
jgi:hypothetical protein